MIIFAKNIPFTMRKILFICFFLLSVGTRASHENLLDSLDKAIEQRNQYIQSKQEKIASLKQKLKEEKDSSAMLTVIDHLYNEYHVFQFDSALVYADRGLSMAKRQGNPYYIALFTIHRSAILSTGGLYSEAVDNMSTLPVSDIDPRLLSKYHLTNFFMYLYWHNYCNDQIYSPQYLSKAKAHLQAAMEHADKNAPLYPYLLGEYHVYVKPDLQEARKHYQRVVEQQEENNRPYAMAAFALAGNYKNDNDQERYEEYLIRAAISDLKGCTMENMALQTLAVHLFEGGDDQIERAERYIQLSMEDAKFYNNRLRIIEISRIMPQIMRSYQATVEAQNRDLRRSIIFISLLVLGLLFTAFYIHRQNRKLAASRHELSDNNRQLKELNQQLADGNQRQADLNEQLKGLNLQLENTNKRRENLASIYIDLCARYIDKLGKYQTLVKRKIKANQAQELLQAISSTRISEEDAATFLHRFDKAFLELYPTFVEEFNALLCEEGRIEQKTPNSLTTELRTFALIRLGVKNTADIAGLLFLSPQTIYNCRSVVKNKAIHKETFDNDVQLLCKTI